MRRKQHTNKEVEAALRHAEKQGWSVVAKGGHAWGRIKCPFNDKDCRCGEFCIASVWSTPKNPSNHARQLMRVVNKCERNIGLINADNTNDTHDEGDNSQ